MARSVRGLFILILAVMLLTGTRAPRVNAQQTPAAHGNQTPHVMADANGYVGNQPCAGCHSDIYNSYMFTTMARASGTATQDFVAGEVQHAASGVHYRVYQDKGDAWLSFERTGEPPVRGTRKLEYFIGSGKRGRTYLFSDDGFVFESPVTWYSQKHTWDVAPAYQKSRTITLNLAAVPACLNCHTSNSQSPLAGTENKYAVPLFAHAGITCERCHGPGAAHVSPNGPIVNPKKLSAEQRDAICMQCHLEGNAAIEQPGHHAGDFQPGQNLSDSVHYFVSETGSGDSFRALSQTEALAHSLCKRKSGDAMSCTSCHDPHSSPSTATRVTYYRAKCLTCHGDAFAAKHHVENPDCTQCHMPRTATADVMHTQATDHAIPRVPRMPLQSLTAADPHLYRFPPSDTPDSNRDLALAWISLAQAGMNSAGPQAEQYLRKALVDYPDDESLLTAMAFVEQRRGNADQARQLYEHALRVDPTLTDAATNLGVLEFKAGHADKAIRLWQDAFMRAPGRSAIGMNLVRVLCAGSQFDKARTNVSRVLEFNPDLPLALQLQKSLNANPPSCALQ
jgi:predicted CXXCH cytochrome family protein